MKKLLLIIKREYKTRIKKPSFLIFCLLTPFFIGALILAPIGINKSNFSETTIKIFDETNIIGDILVKHNQNKFINYEVVNPTKDLYEAADEYDGNDGIMVLRIPDNFIKNQSPTVELFNKNTPGIYVISKVKNDLFDIRKKLLVYSTYKLDLQEFEQKMNSPVSVVFQGEGLNPQMKFFLGLASAFMLYILIIMYGVQVMRSVIEEKSSRIVEIIVSSVKPKTLMKGKIIGIGLVGITQFAIIITFSGILLGVFQSYFGVETSDIINQQLELINPQASQEQQVVTDNIPLFNQEIQHYLNGVSTYLPILLIITPVLFFLGFYLYASLFAAVGSAIDSETDTQQFILPITLPLLISGSIAYSVLQNPHSDLAFWSSIFPLSSPIVMPARIAFMDLSTDWWQILIAIINLVLAVVITTKICGRIYRTGILMYGQKVTYKTLWKWFKQSD